MQPQRANQQSRNAFFSHPSLCLSLRVSLLVLSSVLGWSAVSYSQNFSSDVLVQSSNPDFILFDTSPTSLWQLRGGEPVSEAFSLEWREGSDFGNPIIVENGAPSNALYIDREGHVGLGTAAPGIRVNLHIADPEPDIRFEDTNQPQIWSLSGSGVFGFNVSDITDGATPFSIALGAGRSALRIAEGGNVGLGTDDPEGNLHIHGTATEDVFNGIGPSPKDGPAMNFGYAGNSFGRGAGFFNVRPDNQATGINPALYFATQNLPRMVIAKDGKVGISPNATSLTDVFEPSQALDVDGNIRATGSFIANGTTLNVPDYVFAEDYELNPLKEIAQFVKEHQHLPDIPSAAEVQAEGLNMTTFQLALLRKIEELTLYTLEQEETIQSQAETLEDLKLQLAQLQP